MSLRVTAQPSPINLFERLARFPSYFGRRQSERQEQRDFRPPEPPLWGPNEAALRNAITEQPDAPGPRLRYAEWLQREGDPRGEFIRVQLALSELPEEMAWSPSRDRLLRAERDLLDQHAASWLNEVAPWSPMEATLRRGFVEDVTLTGRSFLSLGEGLFRTTPIRRVRLVAIAPFLAELGRCEWVAKLRGLDLRGNQAGASALSEVIASPFASSLRELDLSTNRIGDQGIRAICSAKHLHSLERLNVADNGIPGELVAGLLTIEHLSKLESLDVSGNAIGS